MFADHFGLRPDRPGPGLLREACAAFSALPWENLTKILMKERFEGRERMRTPETVVRDHVEHGAGGTCFSLTRTLSEILRDWGFLAWPVMGDMRHGRDIHCAVAVEDGGELLISDPGYLICEPYPACRPGRLLSGPGSFEVEIPRAGCISLSSTDEEGRREWRYTLRLDEVPSPVFERHWLRSFDASGMRGLHLSRLEGGRRLYVHDSNLRIGEAGSRRNEKLGEDWAGSVAGRFGISEVIARRALEVVSANRRRR